MQPLLALLTRRLPETLVYKIMHYAAQPQSKELCADIICYIATMDRMLEYFLYNFARKYHDHNWMANYKRLKLEDPSMRLKEINDENICRLLDHPYLFWKPARVTAEMYYRENRFDLDAALLSEIQPDDITNRCPYSTPFNPIRKMITSRRLQLFIGIMTVEERTTFAQQYHIE